MLLRDFLKLSGQTHEQFAQQIGIGQSAISMLANSQRKPSWPTIFAVERATEGQVTVIDWANQIRAEMPEVANDQGREWWAA